MWIEGENGMRSRLPIGFWLPVGALLSIALWYGCEQKGDLSPVTSGQGVLNFIDTITVDPSVLSPNGEAIIEARVVNENDEPTPEEDVRFMVNRGTFGEGAVDTTITTDNYGRARASYNAPPDTGNVNLSVELLSMSDIRSVLIPVRSQGQTLSGVLSLSVADDTLFCGQWRFFDTSNRSSCKHDEQSGCGSDDFVFDDLRYDSLARCDERKR